MAHSLPHDFPESPFARAFLLQDPLLVIPMLYHTFPHLAGASEQHEEQLCETQKDRDADVEQLAHEQGSTVQTAKCSDKRRDAVQPKC